MKQGMNILDRSYFRNSLASHHDLETHPFIVLQLHASEKIQLGK